MSLLLFFSAAPRILTADAASFTLTGQDAGLNFYHIDAEAATFTLSGQDADLTKTAAGVGGYSMGLLLAITYQSGGVINRTLTASPGSFSLTMRANDLRAALQLVATQATFTYTGQDASLLRKYTLTAEAASYTYTGVAVTFAFTGLKYYTLTAAAAAYTKTENAAGLRVARKITAAVNAFTLTGNAAVTKFGRYLSGGTGSYTETGNYAGLLFGRKVIAASSSFTLTGIAASFNDQAAGAYALRADPCAYAVGGQDAGLLAAWLFGVEVAEFTWTGNAASLLTGVVAPTPAARVYIVSAETRELVVPAESRIYTVIE